MGVYQLLAEVAAEAGSADAASKLLLPTPTTPTNALWYEKIIYDPVNAISTSLGIAGVVLGIIPLILLVAEKRKKTALDETLKEFSIREQLIKLREETEQQAKLTQEQKAKLDAEAQSMREDVEQRIPNAALIAYYENTIPQLEKEILAYGARVTAMQEDMARIKKLPTVTNEKVQALLSRTISQTSGAKRRLEALQLFLVLCTSVAGVLVSVIPYPLSNLVGWFFGGITILVVLKMVDAAQGAYPDSKLLTNKFLSTRFIAITLAITVGSVFLIFGGLVLYFKVFMKI